MARFSHPDHQSIISLTDTLIREAALCGASDIHIDPGAAELLVRLRIDGLLDHTYSLPADCHAELIARLKILSGLRTDEHFSAQDGRFTFPISNDEIIDVRISLMPTYHGENAVLRLLARDIQEQSLSGLGMSSKHESSLIDALSRSHGLVLVTGPTGSGKTTTLYSLMQILATHPKSLVSIEDPVEYSMPGINQIQVQHRSGLTFAHGLRAILRQDPDVIMVGEIRDAETAELAIHAALTGHLVLSTLHTNDAQGALPRLRDLGIKPYLIDATLRLVIAQRLVRKACVRCTTQILIPVHEQKELLQLYKPISFAPNKHWIPAGCEGCAHTGHKGRIGIFDLLEFSSSSKSVPGTIFDDGMRKVAEGITTLSELMRIRYE